MTIDAAKLRELAEAAMANAPNWCGDNGLWSRDRALINFRFIQAASPTAVLALLDEREACYEAAMVPAWGGPLGESERAAVRASFNAPAYIVRKALSEVIVARAQLQTMRSQLVAMTAARDELADGWGRCRDSYYRSNEESPGFAWSGKRIAELRKVGAR